MLIDTFYDFRTDAHGKDPDTHSLTLRSYHKFLWSKLLPCGIYFQLDNVTPRSYLHHQSDLGEFFLASDSVMQTFIRWEKLKHIIEQFPEAENEAFMKISYTIGGMIIFPGNKVDGKQTINGARGFTRSIADRMDLTLECIRRYYLGQSSPLGEVLERYADFFALFADFRGYVEYFLLDDLVVQSRDEVNFFMPFDDFVLPSVPQDLDTYIEYRQRSIDFIVARNQRITAWCQAANTAVRNGTHFL